MRRGSDIVTAAALGATFSFTGRATVYGVAGGGVGASRTVEILRNDVVCYLAMLGCRLSKSLADIAEANNCVAHMFLLWFTTPCGAPNKSEHRRRSGSELRQAAVDGDLTGGHEAAVVRREEGSRRPEFRRIAHALERSHRAVGLLALLA